MDNLELPLDQGPDVFTVSELNREARRLIESSFGVVWIEGEISNLARPSSGHFYLSLKDENAQVRCAMFRQANRTLKFVPENGQQILARGRVGLYEARGEFQMVLEHIELAGEGLLRQRFEELKRKLAAEGLFDAAQKQPLPLIPKRIGVVTSPSGAAVRDIVTVLGRRFPAVSVLIYPTSVQGERAAKEIAQALKLANTRNECDLLILARGGGSLEDLWSFNEEVVARAIAAVNIPVISAVGHEIDITIADFVADLRAPTPSGAAEMAVPEQSEWTNAVTAISDRLLRATIRRIHAAETEIGALLHRLGRSHPGIQLRESNQRLDELEARLKRGWDALTAKRRTRLTATLASLRSATPQRQLMMLRERSRWNTGALQHAILGVFEQRQTRLGLVARALQAVSPLATLDRGYAIVTSTRDGAVITNAETISPGAEIGVQLARGELTATVAHSSPGTKPDGEA
jgi:exodeoxyribonuclease VII large subunit